MEATLFEKADRRNRWLGKNRINWKALTMVSNE